MGSSSGGSSSGGGGAVSLGGAGTTVLGGELVTLSASDNPRNILDDGSGNAEVAGSLTMTDGNVDLSTSLTGVSWGAGTILRGTAGGNIAFIIGGSNILEVSPSGLYFDATGGVIDAVTPSALQFKPNGSTLVAQFQLPANNGIGFLAGIYIAETSVTTATTLSPGTYSAYLCNGTFTVTFPTAHKAGQICCIKNTGTGTVTIATTSGAIDGASTLVLSTQYESVIIMDDGTNYQVLAANSVGIV